MRFFFDPAQDGGAIPEKLHLNNTADLVRFAIETGLY